MSLRLRILFITSALVVGVVGTLLFVLGRIVNRQYEATVSQVTERTGQVLVQTVAEQGRHLGIETALLADKPATKNMFRSDSKTTSDYLEELSGLIQVDWALMTDADGKVLGMSSRGPDSFRLKGLQKQKPYQGVSRYGSSQVVVCATQPIFSNEYLVEVLVTARELDAKFLKQIGSATGCEVAVVTNNYVMSATVPIKQTVVMGQLTSVNANGKKYIGKTVSMPGTGSDVMLQMMALVPEEDLAAPFAPLWTTLYALLVAGLLLAVAGGLWLAWNLTKPLEGLISAARTLQLGGWPEPMGKGRSDEIGLLQNVFDEMTVSLRTSHERLVAMLDLDPLTDLRNYRSFRSALEDMIEDSVNRTSLAIFDIDQFENYNMAYGADAGDEVLRAIAKIIREDSIALCARYGGNTFAIAGTSGIVQAAERIRQRVADQGRITITCGVATTGETIAQADLLLLAAEMATTQAKSAGRNRVREFKGFELTGDVRKFLQQGSYSAIRALAEAVDAKDEYTRGHSERVATFGKQLAESCGYDAGFVELVFVTGTLHDVGKIGVPDSALKKQGKLTEEEYDLIKLHPELGEKIVSQLPQLVDCLPGIRHHHERWDGRGYPDGLAGEAIPEIARILAVADTFDAMTSDRPYRKGMPVDIALDEITRGAGTQFDARFAEAFVQMWLGTDLQKAA